MAVEAFLLDSILSNFKQVPTPCQKNLFEKLASFTASFEECDILIVSGYAGTGKTSALGAYVRTLKELDIKFVLLSPTGRSAKVLSSFTGERATTIHKHIYRQKSLSGGLGEFTMDINKSKDTIFIVDEASLISSSDALVQDSIFGSGDLLSDLVNYVRAGVDCKLILVGDPGQLPPVGMELSPALDCDFMRNFGKVLISGLTSVVRQASDSGILSNATSVRKLITSGLTGALRLDDSFPDIGRIDGSSLVEALSDNIDRYGIDNVAVLCRSNKRANRYNAGIRSMVLGREEQLCRGDKLMVVKNCYQFLEDIPELDFIANGDVASLVKISNYEERYGINFADAILRFPDYDNVEITAKLILDTLKSETSSLEKEKQQALFEGVYEDYNDIRTKKERYRKVREDRYFNALQIKYASAITCHKAQGGQWDCIFIDNPFWNETTVEDLKWLYTAMTRAVKKIYFVNFKDEFFI